ncbi:MAG: rod shape-determining protein MreC [Bacteroidaceae bacterium]|nr:rod shape-determining protein MreC [Bacteroidaceae bacterium]
MRALLEFIAKYYHWAVFTALEVIAITLLLRFNNYQGSVWLTTANTVVGTAQQWHNEAIRFIHLGQVNADLMRRNLRLEQNVEFLQAQLDSVTHDSTAAERLQAQRLRPLDIIPAKVITNSVLRRNNLITINRGRRDGIEPEQGVVSGTGIVGIIYMVSDHFSIVMPLLNSHSSISCALRGTRYFGYLRWDGTDPLFCYLDDIPRHARFRVGDIVETSGNGSIFPRGLFVGRVAAIENSDDGLSYKLRIHLGINFSRLADVAVIRQEFQPEVRELEQKADSAMAR